MGVADGGNHEILQRLHVVRVDRLRVDRDRGQLTATVEGRGDKAAAGAAGDLGLGQLGLRLRELLLHLLGLLHQLLHVRLAAEPASLLRHGARLSVGCVRL